MEIRCGWNDLRKGSYISPDRIYSLQTRFIGRAWSLEKKKQEGQPIFPADRARPLAAPVRRQAWVPAGAHMVPGNG